MTPTLEQNRTLPAPTQEATRGPCFIRPIESQAELAQLQMEAVNDAHLVLGATHLILRDGEIVGYVSINGMTLVQAWVHSQKVRARDSLSLINIAENLAFQHHNTLVMPCAIESPFRPVMQKLGYLYAGESGLFLKGRGRLGELKKG